jgi:hypothetical protein
MRIGLLVYATISLFAAANPCLALPELDSMLSLSVDGKQVQYMRDDTNPNAYYFLPNDLIVMRDDQGLRFGFQHWGITAEDTEGVGGNFAFTVRPSWDEDLMDKAQKELQKSNASATLSAVPIEKSYFDVIMTGNFATDKAYVVPPALLDDYTIKYSTTLKDLGITLDGAAGADKTKNVLESVMGSGGDGPQGFTISLTNLGGRLSAETPNVTADQAGFLVVRYRYMVKGVTPKFRAELRVHYRKTFEHFRAKFGGGGWFWRSSHVVDLQTMKQDGSIELKVVTGAVDDKNETLIDSVFQSLVNARINGTGMFAPQLRPAAMGGGDDQGLGSFFGWSFNSSSAFQKLDESVDQVFIIDKQNIQHRAFSIGTSLGPLCSSNKDKFQNLTQPSKPCITDADIEGMISRSRGCIKSYLDEAKQAKEIDQALFDEVMKRLKKQCGA